MRRWRRRSLVRRGDGHDGTARRRPCGLLRRGDAAHAEPRLLRRGAGARRRARDAELVHLDVPFGAELVHYAVGPPRAACPGCPPGSARSGTRTDGSRGAGSSSRRCGWRRRRRDAVGARRLPRDARPRDDDERRRGDLLARRHACWPRATVLEQPGLVAALELLADEARARLRGSIARALLELCAERGGSSRSRPRRIRGTRGASPSRSPSPGTRFLTRGGLSGVPETLRAAAAPAGRGEPERVLALVDALDAGGPATHTTNLAVVDADGNACVLTTSLGLGSGDFLPGLDLHLNSMLGEADLLRGRLEPGERMQSMMAPTLALRRRRARARDRRGRRHAAAHARSSSVAAGILDEGLAPQEAVDRPRVHPAGGRRERRAGRRRGGARGARAAGRTVRRWPAPHHYFGGVSASGRAALPADPRRSGGARFVAQAARRPIQPT